jgi:hypothetical protein
MKKDLCFVLCGLVLPLSGYCGDPPTPEQIKRLVREFAFISQSNLNANTTFHIRKLEVPKLWEELKVEIFDVEYRGTRDQWFNGFVGMYNGGKISVLAPTVGGHGLMSGVMRNGEFFYTYSWGSGIHRSHVAKLRLEKGEMKFWDSGGFQDIDLFVTADSSGGVHINSGKFKDFNKCESDKRFGTLSVLNSREIQIVGTNGEVISPTFPFKRNEKQ